MTDLMILAIYAAGLILWCVGVGLFEVDEVAILLAIVWPFIAGGCVILVIIRLPYLVGCKLRGVYDKRNS